MKNLVLISVYGDQNIGDAAILKSTLELIEQSLSKPSNLFILCAYPNELTVPVLSNLKIIKLQKPFGYAIRSENKPISSIVKIHRLISIFYFSFYYYFLDKFKIHNNPKKGFYSYIETIKNADFVISLGGGYFRTKNKYKDYFGLLLTLLPVYISKLYKKKITFLPMSFGEFASFAHKKLTFEAIKNTDLFIREDRSVKELNSISKGHKLNIKLSPDLALYINYEHSSPGQKISSDYVVLTAINWFKDIRKQDAYENALKLFIEFLWKNHKLRTIFIPMTWSKIEENDKSVGLRIQKKIQIKKVFSIKNVTTPGEVMDILDSSHLAICTRMHSAILASVVRTPFICIEYEHKTLGFLRMLGYENWNINIKNLDFENLKNKFEELHLKKEYLSFIKSLDKKMKELKKEKVKLVNNLSLSL